MTQLTEREQADVGNRALKNPGDVAWCWQTITALQFMWENLQICHRSYLQIWREAEEHAIWEKVPPDNPYGTKLQMLERLKIGDEDSANAKVAGLAAITKPLKQHGGHLPKNGKEDDLGRLPRKKGSNRSDYLAARIARDHPEIHRRMMNGEFKSVADAARAAGIYRARPKSIGLVPDVNRVAVNIRKYYTLEQVQALKDAL